jgi:membrane fusion protein (multidrug efflux system)
MRLLLALCTCISVALATAASSGPPVIVAEAQRQPFVDRVEALGTLLANESVVVSSSVSEIVSAIRFDDGQRVAAGDILVELSSAEVRAALAEAEATVAEARSQYDRVLELARRGTEARALLDERRRQWETALARRLVVESRLQNYQVRAPFAGVVGLRNISLGALVEPGDVITTLDDDSIMKLEFSVPSVFLSALRPGLLIVASASAYRDREFRGEVRSIDSRVDPVTRSLLVRAVVPNPERALKPGMLMTVELQKDPREAVVIPEAALVPQGRRQYVLVVDEAAESRVERREIRIGGRRLGEVEVVAGLEAGEKVITHGTERAQPGRSVVIQAVDDGSRSLETLLGAAAVAAPVQAQ